MKRRSKALTLFLFFLYLFNSPLLISQLIAQQNKNQESLGLVLSGGGAKGFAHIGVLRVFEEENIPITLISGTSMGNIIGALYSVGYSPDEIEEFAKRQDWSMLLTDDIDRRLKSRFKQEFEEKHPLVLSLNRENRKLSLPAGLVKGNNILNIFCGMTAAYPDSVNFSDLPIPFSCVAYDLNSAQEVVIDHGHLAKAMLTSMAIPGIFAPVEYKNQRFVDGGVINNFPVDVAIDMGADIIIGVDLRQENEDDKAHYESITTILRGIVSRLETEKHDENVEKANIVINPNLKGITALDFETELIDTIIIRGERAAREQMPKIKELIKNRDIIKNNNRNELPPQEWLITEIKTPDTYNKDVNIILQQLDLEVNNTYTMGQIDSAVKRVYGFGNFDNVYYKLNQNKKGYTLELLIDNKKESEFMVGGALNTVDITSIYVNYSYHDYSKAINLMTFDAKIARNPQMLFMLETNRLLSTSGFALRGRYNRMDYRDSDKTSGRMRAGSVTSSLYTYRRFRESADFNIGINETYFYSNDYYRSNAGIDDSKVSRFYTSAYGVLTIDNRNRSFIPDRGIYLKSEFTLLTETKDFRYFIPIANLSLNTLTPLSGTVSFTADLYHRSVISDNLYSPYFANYSSNRYNAYTDFYFPLLGQGGITILDPISSLGEIGLRVEVSPKHYIIPRIQLLWQMDDWSNINIDKHNWGAGLTYQHRSKLSRLDFTIGFNEFLNRVNFNGGIGYQF